MIGSRRDPSQKHREYFQQNQRRKLSKSKKEMPMRYKKHLEHQIEHGNSPCHIIVKTLNA